MKKNIFITLFALLSGVASANTTTDVSGVNFNYSSLPQSGKAGAPSESLFCKMFKDKLTMTAYTVPDGKKPYSLLKKEINKLNEMIEKERKKENPDPLLISEYTNLINKKEDILSQKINYHEAISQKKTEKSRLEREKRETHKKFLKLLSLDPATRDEKATELCGSYTTSPAVCQKEEELKQQLIDVKNELKQLNRLYHQEQKWVAKTLSTKQGKNIFNRSKLKEAATTFYGIPVKGGSVSLNKDGNGTTGSVTAYATQFYSCAENNLTPNPKNKGTLINIPMVIMKSDNPGATNVLFCAKTFLGEGDCAPLEKMTNPDSGWESATIAKNAAITPISDGFASFHNDHIFLKSECEDIGTENEKCTLTVKTVSMGDIDKDNISVKTADILSKNPSYNKVVETATSGTYQQTYKSQKKEFHNENGCSFKAIDATSGSDVPEIGVLTCDDYEKDENGRIKKTLSADGTEEYSRISKDKSVNLLNDCPQVEKCLVEKKEKTEYTEGCVSPFPLDQVVIKTDVPEGNCALKFDKDMYTCDAKRVMDTRSCLIKRYTGIEKCPAKLTTKYNSYPVPSVTDEVNGRQVIRFQTSEDIDSAYEMSPSNAKITSQVGSSYKGAEYFTVNQVFRKEDLGKYVVFKIMTYHNNGNHAQDGLSGSSFRTWGNESCNPTITHVSCSGLSDDDWCYEHDLIDLGVPWHGDAQQCGNVTWFVINLQDESGGKINPPTWQKPGYGKVIEVSRVNSFTINAGYYGHSENSKRQWGGSPDEGQWMGIISIEPITEGEPWCSPVEEQKIIDDSTDNWEAYAPYAKCGVKFKHNSLSYIGNIPPFRCPSGTEVVSGGAGFEKCAPAHTLQNRFNGMFLLQSDYDNTGSGYALISRVGYDDMDGSRSYYSARVGKFGTYCVAKPNSGILIKDMTSFRMPAPKLTLDNSDCDTTYPTAVQKSNECQATWDAWKVTYDAYQTCLSNAAASNNATIQAARDAYNAQVAEIDANYSAQMDAYNKALANLKKGETPPSPPAAPTHPTYTDPTVTPPAEQCASQKPEPEPDSRCSIADKGWPYPYTPEYQYGPKMIEADYFTNEKFVLPTAPRYYKKDEQVDGTPTGGSYINNFSDFIIPHLTVKKVISSEANSCLPFNDLRDDDPSVIP